MTCAETFLTKEEQQRVSAAVQEAEKHTSGEIVPMIVTRSGEYPLSAVRLCASVSLLFAFLTTLGLGPMLGLGSQNLFLFLTSFVLCSAVCVLFLGFRLLPERFSGRFISAREKDREVQRMALVAFYREGLRQTAARNGILVYISVLERRVWILADKGINEVLPPETWSDLVTDISTGIRQGDACASLCAAIRKIGVLLQEAFPYQHGDIDELHNLIIRSDVLDEKISAD